MPYYTTKASCKYIHCAISIIRTTHSAICGVCVINGSKGSFTCMVVAMLVHHYRYRYIASTSDQAMGSMGWVYAK
jgi:hypothetical protein